MFPVGWERRELTLTQKHLDSIILPSSFLSSLPSPIPNEHISASAHGELYQPKIFPSRCFVQQRRSRIVIKVRKIDSFDSWGFEQTDEYGGRRLAEWRENVAVKEGPIVGIQKRARIYEDIIMMRFRYRC
jgi:hypothetical protein